MNSLDAAAVVLGEADGPLHYREISERILERGLWQTSGKTPWDTVNARLAVDIKRGADSRFRRVAPGMFTLSEESPSQESTTSASATPAVETFSFTDAAEQVLLRVDDNQPLHYGEITRRALNRSLIQTEGLTPDATMYSVIIQEIRRREARGERQRFVQHGRGLIGLTDWLPRGLAGDIEVWNREVRQQLLDRVQSETPEDFEHLVAELLAKLGFEEIAVTPLSGDGGIDVRGTLVVGEVIRTRMAVQAKRWKGNVRAPEVQRVRGSLGAHEQGLVITTSDFSVGAREEAARPDASPVALMNGEQLVALLAEHGVGVRRHEHVLLVLEEDEIEPTAQ